MSNSELSHGEVVQIWAILVEEVDVRDDQRELESFAYHQLSHRCHEYRLNSSLGFGGKFKIAGDGRWHVDAYCEDETPERQRKIDKANARLAQLQANRRSSGDQPQRVQGESSSSQPSEARKTKAVTP